MLALSFRRLALVGLLAIAPAAMGHAQKELVGEWQGTVDAQGQMFHLLWHVTTAPDGSVVSTFDNVDEGAMGIKVKSMALNGSTLTVTIDDTIQAGGQDVHIAGVLTGKVNADFSEVKGTWEQTQPQEQTTDIELKRGPAAEKPAAAAQAPPVAAGGQAGKIAGDWQGTLNAGGAELRLILHLKTAEDGKLSATLDSVDQGAIGIPVSAASLDGSKLKLTVDAVQGSYEGTVNADASAIAGTWTQGQSLELNFKRAEAAAAKPAPKPAAPTEIDGMWQGALDAGAMKLRIVLKFANTTDGLTAQLQSPDQSPAWMPATSVTRDGDSITVEMKALGASFAGKLAADKQSIDGTFTQMGNATPLTVRR